MPAFFGQRRLDHPKMDLEPYNDIPGVVRKLTNDIRAGGYQ